MRRIEGISLVAMALTSLAIACSSSSNGGGCADFRGTYVGTLTCSGSAQSSSATVTQSGCMLTVAFTDGPTITGTASGNKATTTQTQGAVTQTCETTINGNQYTQSCTIKSGGQTVDTCTGSGTRTGVPDAGGSTGAGGSMGTGGGPGAGGSAGVGGGGPPPQCGIVWSTTAACEACMNSMCCSQMQACAPGTGCDALLNCIAANCLNSADQNCVQNSCSAQVSAGLQAVTNLVNCNATSCQSCE